MSKRAIVTGVLGMDGSNLSKYLLELGYDVYGVYKRVSSGNIWSNIDEFRNHPRFHLICGDICDAAFINKMLADIQPDEYYALAAMSHVGMSFSIPLETFDVDARAVLIQLEAIRHFSPTTKFYNAATSELFGGKDPGIHGMDESAEIYPRSPYAIAKSAAYYYVRNMREAYNIFAVSGILFNHGAKNRGIDFSERKITNGIAKIVNGKSSKLKMGDLSAFRDLGASYDYVRAMHLMLQQSNAEDYVVATGTGATIEEMFKYVCNLAGLKFEDVYELDPQFIRPSDVPRLLGNPTKIKSIGWMPKYTWQDLLKEMFENDLKLTNE